MPRRVMPDDVAHAATRVALDLDGDARKMIAVASALLAGAVPNVKDSQGKQAVENAHAALSYALGKIGWPQGDNDVDTPPSRP